MNAKHVLRLSDWCYSGTMTRASLATFGGGMAAETRDNCVRAMAPAVQGLR